MSQIPLRERDGAAMLSLICFCQVAERLRFLCVCQDAQLEGWTSDLAGIRGLVYKGFIAVKRTVHDQKSLQC